MKSQKIKPKGKGKRKRIIYEEDCEETPKNLKVQKQKIKKENDVTLQFLSASHYLKKNKKICSGSTSVDKILKGGFEKGVVTEIFGDSRTGKTQMCFTLCLTAQLPENDGGGRVIFVDIDGTFRPSRLEDACTRFGLEYMGSLGNILVKSPRTVKDQFEVVGQCKKLIETSENRYSLVIIDSATSLFRTEFAGRKNLAKRQQLLLKYLKELTDLTRLKKFFCFLS